MYSNFNILSRPLLGISLIFISFIVCQSDLSVAQSKEPFRLLKLDKNYYPNKNNSANIILDGKLDELYWSEINFINLNSVAYIPLSSYLSYIPFSTFFLFFNSVKK